VHKNLQNFLFNDYNRRRKIFKGILNGASKSKAASGLKSSKKFVEG